MPCIASFALRQYSFSCLSSTASWFLGKRQAARFCAPVHPIRKRVLQQTACFTGKSDLMTTAEYDDELTKAMNALSTLITRSQRGDGRNYATAYDYMQVYLEVCPVTQCGLWLCKSIHIPHIFLLIFH